MAQVQGTNIQSDSHISQPPNTTAHTCTCKTISPDQLREVLKEFLKQIDDGSSTQPTSLWEKKFSERRRELYKADSPKWGMGELAEVAPKFLLGRNPAAYAPGYFSKLGDLLNKAEPGKILAKNTSTAKVAILDQRNDDGLEPSTRFGSYPAKGNSVQVLFVDQAELYYALSKDVSIRGQD